MPLITLFLCFVNILEVASKLYVPYIQRKEGTNKTTQMPAGL